MSGGQGLLPVPTLPSPPGENTADAERGLDVATGEAGTGAESDATFDGAASKLRSPMRKLAGSLLGVLSRKPAASVESRVADELGQTAGSTSTSGGPGEPADDGGNEDMNDAVQQRAQSPLLRFTGALNAAFRSLSPPRTAANAMDGRDEPPGSSGSSQPRDAKSMPAKSPMRSPLASARSLPDNAGVGASRFKSAAKVVSAASKFKRGAQRQRALVEGITEELDEAEEQTVDFDKALQQAEDGILRELHKENRLLWKLDRAGVLEEINANFRSHVKKSAALFEFVDFDYSNEVEDEKKARITQERYVRCFVSAPYSDMQAERRLLAQEVFPAIRQRCMEIGVHFMEVDFCWGVSESIAERKSNIMERMLEMRQNIKTYIIGLVAERYGYTYLLDATPGHLAQDPMYIGKRAAVLGLQEIELDEGPLARDIPHSAFYYFRDSRYVSEVEDPQVRSSLQSEGLLARERLSHLKAKLRLSNVPIRENYKDPEEFATLALKDLTTKITEDFPHDPTKDMLIQVDEQLMHEFEESTLKTFEGREEEMSALDERVLSVQTVRRPTIVVGEEGVGKSAFLVAWNRRFARKHSFDFMYTHYSGLNTESGSWAGIVRGILQGLKDKFNLRKEIPNAIELLPGAFSLWLGIMASLSARVIIMIDAVDRIHDIHLDPDLEPPPADDDEEDDDDHPLERQPRRKPPHDLFWLPTIVPQNVRIVVSVTEGTPMHEQLVARKWGVFKLNPLDDDSRQVLLDRYMKSRGLEMPEGLQKKLLERGPMKKPLFLVTVLRSLQHPDDMKPTGPLGTFMYVRGITELATMVLDRIENLNGLQERHGLVEEVLSCVSLSRRGLSEPEIIGMMQVPRALFCKFYLHTRSLFQVFFGLMSFTSGEFDREVRRRYLVHEEIVIMVRSRIASYFVFRPLTSRTVEEVPWQYFQSRKWTELATILSNPEVFMILTNSLVGMFDLIIYWESLTLDPHSSGGGANIVDKMEDCVRKSKESQFPVYEQIALIISAGDILQRLNFFDIAMTFFRRACDLEDREIGLSAISKVEYMLKETRVFLKKGDFSATRRMYDRTIKALTDVVDVDGDGEITYEELKATDAGTLLLDTEEELMFMLYEGQYYSSLEEMCLHMLGRDEGRPTNELLLFDVLINTYMETGKLDSAHDFMSRALKAIKLPECDEFVHVLSRKLGLCLLRENYLQVIESVEASGWVFEAITGGDEENIDELIDVLAYYACALSQSGRADEAVPIYMVAVDKQYPPETEEIDDSSSSSGSELSSIGDIGSEGKRNTHAQRHNVIITDVMLLDLVGSARREIYDPAEAEEHHLKALQMKVLSFGPKDACVAYTLSEMGALHESKRDMAMALKMRKAACAIIKECMGDRNSRYYMALQAQAACHWKFGDLESAYAYAKIVQGGIERSFGSRSELLPASLLLMGLILTSLGELSEAEQFLKRSHDLATTIWGQGCVAASNAMLGLALVEERNGAFEMAELKLRQTMQAREDMIGPLHSYLQQDLAATSLLYYRIEAYHEVEDLLRTSLPAMQAVHGPRALCVAGILSLLALTHARVGKNTINDTEADPVALVLRALRIRREIFGPSAALNQHEMLTALVLVHLGQHKRAEPMFRKAYARATSSRKTPRALRWLLYNHMVRSGKLGFVLADRPLQPAWSAEYRDIAFEEPTEEESVLALVVAPDHEHHPPTLGAGAVGIVELVMDDIQETADARERDEAAEAAAHAAHRAQASAGSSQSDTVRSASSSRGRAMSAAGRDTGSEKSGETSREHKDTFSTTPRSQQEAVQQEDSVVGGHATTAYDRLQLDGLIADKEGRGGGQAADVVRSARSERMSELSSVHVHKGGTPRSERGSSVGTEQASEDLDMLMGVTVVDMMDNVFSDVVAEFPSARLGPPSARRPQIVDSEYGARTLLRPLTAPGVGRKPARLQQLLAGVRPQTAGAVRPGSALHAIIRFADDEDEDEVGDEESKKGRKGILSLPRLSMTAVGRSRRRRMDGFDAHDEDGNTALHAAVRDNDTDAVKSLLEARANASTTNKAGQAPLHLAARAGHARIVKLLTGAGANVNHAGPDGRTPLHFAVESGALGLVQILCETLGADVSAQSNSGETPLVFALGVLGADAAVSRYLTTAMASLPAL